MLLAEGLELTDLGTSTRDGVGAVDGDLEELDLAVLALDERLELVALVVVLVATLLGPLDVDTGDGAHLVGVESDPPAATRADPTHDDVTGEVELSQREGDLGVVLVLGGEEDSSLLLDAAERGPAGVAVELAVLDVESGELVDGLEELRSLGRELSSHNGSLRLLFY